MIRTGLGSTHRIGIGLAAALCLAATRAGALECSLASTSPSWIADSATFTLRCDGPVPGAVEWEFGDGGGDTTPTGVLIARHRYAAIGSYTVFARLPGAAFPAILQHTVLHAPTARAATRASTVILDAARSRAWCVNADNHSVTVIDAKAFTRVKEIPVGRHPRTLALDGQGRVWVVNQDDATLTVIDGGSLSVLQTVSLPRASRPHGICFSPDGGTAYVTLEAKESLVRLDAITRQVTGTIKLFPTPRGIAVSADGARILVTRFLSPRDRGEVADVSAAPFALTRVIPLAYDTHTDTESNGGGVPNALASVTISPDGRMAWIPFKKDNVRRGLFVDPASEAPTSESTVRTGVALVDLAAAQEEYVDRKDLDNRSMASAVAFDSKGAYAFVSTLTSNHIAVLDNATGLPITAYEPVDLDRELAPDGLAVAPGDSLLFVHYFMSREMAVYRIAAVGGSNEMPRLALIPTVAAESLPPQVLKGKQVFYNAADPRMAHERYLSCAVCHLDGASDGRVWDFTHKGEGMRRTTSLLGRAGMGHGPVHWSANFDEIQDFEHDMRGAFGGKGFLPDAEFLAGRDTPLGARKSGVSADLDALAAYVASLTRVNPSPHRNADGTLTAEAMEGEKIFRSPEARCATCHAGPRYTDSELSPIDFTGGIKTMPGGFLLHDVGTLKAGSGKRLNDTLKGIDTPTLLGLWETGPYLHDGYATTLMDVLTTANPADRHGKTSDLTATQKDQLVAFLLQLDQGDPPVGIAPSPRLRAPDGLGFARAGNGYRLSVRIPAGVPAMRLRFFDAAGRSMADVVPSFRARSNGLSAFDWDGRDSRGHPLPTGLYHLRLEWPGGRMDGKALLLPR